MFPNVVYLAGSQNVLLSEMHVLLEMTLQNIILQMSSEKLQQSSLWMPDL